MKSPKQALTPEQERAIGRITEAEIASVVFGEPPFVTVVVAGNGKYPRMMTVWRVEGHSPTAVPELETGIPVNPEIVKGFYGGEIQIGDDRMRIAFGVLSSGIIPYVERDRTNDPDAIERWQAGEYNFHFGETSNIVIDGSSTNGEVNVVAGGLPEKFMLQFANGKPGLTQQRSPRPAIQSVSA